MPTKKVLGHGHAVKIVTLTTQLLSTAAQLLIFCMERVNAIIKSHFLSFFHSFLYIFINFPCAIARKGKGKYNSNVSSRPSIKQPTSHEYICTRCDIFRVSNNTTSVGKNKRTLAPIVNTFYFVRNSNFSHTHSNTPQSKRRAEIIMVEEDKKKVQLTFRFSL